MTPSEWNAAMAPDVPWQEAYATVEREVKILFAHNPLYDHDTVGTGTLVEGLYPETYARGEGITARRRIFKALQALATRGLADYASKGPPKLNKMKVMAKPWMWHAPLRNPTEDHDPKRKALEEIHSQAVCEPIASDTEVREMLNNCARIAQEALNG